MHVQIVFHMEENYTTCNIKLNKSLWLSNNTVVLTHFSLVVK